MASCWEHDCVCTSNELRLIDHPSSSRGRICDCIFHNSVIALVEIKCGELKRDELSDAVDQLKGCLDYIAREKVGSEEVRYLWAYVLCKKVNKYLAPMLNRLTKRYEKQLRNYAKSIGLRKISDKIYFAVKQGGRLQL